MSITLNLEDPLAAELRQEASAEHVSPEELAHRLVREALDQRIAARHWQAHNRRRLELIAKKLQSPLTADEMAELGQLQSLAERTAAPFDRALLNTATELRHAIDALPQEQLP